MISDVKEKGNLIKVCTTNSNRFPDILENKKNLAGIASNLIIILN